MFVVFFVGWLVLVLFLAAGAPNKKWKRFLELLIQGFVFCQSLHFSSLGSSVA